MTTLRTGWTWTDDTQTRAETQIGATKCAAMLNADDNDNWSFTINGGEPHGNYSAGYAMECAERAAKRVAIRTLALAVVSAMGPEWAAAKPRQGDDPTEFRGMIGPGGAFIYVHVSEYGSDAFSKIRLSGSHVDNKAFNDSLRYNVTAPSINVSASKSATQIAADIKRRLLPDLMPLIEACNTRLAEVNTHQTLSARTAAKVAKAIGGKVETDTKWHKANPDRPEIRLNDSRDFKDLHERLTVSGGKVTIPSFTLAADAAIEVLKAIAKIRKGSK